MSDARYWRMRASATSRPPHRGRSQAMAASNSGSATSYSETPLRMYERFCMAHPATPLPGALAEDPLDADRPSAACQPASQPASQMRDE